MFKQLLNPDQNAGNTLKVGTTGAGCCGDALSVCQYTASFTDTDTISAVTIKDRDGTTNKTLSFTGVTGVANIKAAILAAMAAEGYEDDGDLVPGITVVDGGANITVTIVGEVTMVSITDTGGPTSFTAKCTQIGLCTFTADYTGGNGDVLTVNGVNATLGDLTFATASAANVKSALEGAANWPANSVATVVKNTTDSVFEVSISSPSTNLFTLDGVELDRADCTVAFV